MAAALLRTKSGKFQLLVDLRTVAKDNSMMDFARRLSVLSILLLLLAGCGIYSYHARDWWGYGFSETQLESNVYFVEYNGYDQSVAIVMGYWHQRARELCQSLNNQNYVVITQQHAIASQGTYVASGAFILPAGSVDSPRITGTIRCADRLPDTAADKKRRTLSVSVLPVMIPPLLSTPIHQRLAVIPLLDATDSTVSSWLDLTLNFLRSRHPQVVLVERETLGLAVQEAHIQHTGRVADESMVRVGRLAGADTLLTYRLDALPEETITSVRRNGGQVLGSTEFRLIHVESGTTIFRQAVTATIGLDPPGSGKTWPEESVRQVHRAALENAVSYGLASLTMAYGDNPLGVVPDLTSAGEGMAVLGVLQGGPAHVAGIKVKDRIVSLNGTPFTSWAAPMTLPVALTIQREGKIQEVKVMEVGR